MSSAVDTDSSSVTRSSGSVDGGVANMPVPPGSGSGSHSPTYRSRRARAEPSWSRQTRLATRVSHAAGFSIDNALLATGAFSFLLLGHVIREDPQPTIDTWAFDVADRLRNDMLVDLATSADIEFYEPNVAWIEEVERELE